MLLNYKTTPLAQRQTLKLRLSPVTLCLVCHCISVLMKLSIVQMLIANPVSGKACLSGPRVTIVKTNNPFQSNLTGHYTFIEHPRCCLCQTTVISDETGNISTKPVLPDRLLSKLQWTDVWCTSKTQAHKKKKKFNYYSQTNTSWLKPQIMYAKR